MTTSILTLEKMTRNKYHNNSRFHNHQADCQNLQHIIITTIRMLSNFHLAEKFHLQWRILRESVPPLQESTRSRECSLVPEIGTAVAATSSGNIVAAFSANASTKIPKSANVAFLPKRSNTKATHGGSAFSTMRSQSSSTFLDFWGYFSSSVSTSSWAC